MRAVPPISILNLTSGMLFYSIFKQMSEKASIVTVELKNGVEIQGKLGDVDQNMNFFLYEINVDLEKYPQFGVMKNMYIRGSSVRQI